MSTTIRILLADDNIDFSILLDEYLSQIEDFEVVGIAHNGLEAVDKIEELKPDIVLLDIMMPRLGGLGVLAKINSLNMQNKPQFIILTALNQDKATQIMLELGADFFILKPFDLDELVATIKQFTALKGFKQIRDKAPCEAFHVEPNVEKKIIDLLNLLGVPPHLRGYTYLLYAIEIILNDLSAINALSKHIYSKISEKYNTTPSRVERVIRNAIEITWNRGNIEILDKIFGYDLSGEKTKPSNSEFFIKFVNELLDKSEPKQRIC